MTRPSLYQINVNHLVPFQQVFDEYSVASHSGDTLNIVNTGDSGDVTGTLDTILVPAVQFDAQGRVLTQNGTAANDYYTRAAALTYTGGEPVIDPFTHTAMHYSGGEPTYDLFSPTTQIFDPFGNPVLHHAATRCCITRAIRSSSSRVTSSATSAASRRSTSTATRSTTRRRPTTSPSRRRRSCSRPICWRATR